MIEMGYCDSCEDEVPKADLLEGGDPWGLGPRYYACDPCNDKAADRYLESLYE